MAKATTQTRRARSKASSPGARNTLPHFEAFCAAYLVLDNGHPLKLEAFQKAILGDYFDGARETLVLLPSGNGKTTLFAALALYHLIFTSDAACYIAASSRDQAKLLYNHACGFVARNKQAKRSGLDQVVDIKKGTYEIRSASDSGFLRVLAADANTADGVGPTLALVDELHRHKSSDLFAVFLKGLKKRRGQIVTISTAGSDEDSPLGRMRTRALHFPTVVRSGKHVVARSSDGHQVMHEWALDPGDSRTDVKLVKQCNPASFVTVADLAAEMASMQPWEWARFACNVWVQGEHAAISPLDWARCGVDNAEIPDGADVWIGVDLGWKWDSTAIVPLWMDNGFANVGRPAIIIPPRDGTSTREGDIVRPLLDMVRQWHVRGVVIDPKAGGEQLGQHLEGEHELTVVTHSQDPAPMALAAERLAGAIREGTLRHPNDPALTSHVLAAAAKVTTGEKWRFAKAPRGGKPIDAVIALAMALSVAIDNPVARNRGPLFEVIG